MFDGVIRTLGDMRQVPNLRKKLVSLKRSDNLDYDFSVSNKFMDVGNGLLVITKGKKINNLYKLIGDLVQDGATTIVNGKMNIGDRLNLKSYISNDNVRWEKHVKFNVYVTVFCDNNMVLKGCSQGVANTK